MHTTFIFSSPRVRCYRPNRTTREPAAQGAPWDPEWEAEWRQLEAERERSKVYQFAFWPDDERAMPTAFLACALFAALHVKNAPNLRGERISSVNGYAITYTGKRLTQVHADIVMGVFHLMRCRPEGEIVEFGARSFLRLIGRSTGKTDRDSFRQLIDDIIATAIRITKPDGTVAFSGSILTLSTDRKVADDTLIRVKVERDLAKLFAGGFGKIDWAKRQCLMRKPLCQWLQLYLSTFGAKPVAVAELHCLSGSTAPLKTFRQNLPKALIELEKECVARAVLDGQTDAVRRLPFDVQASSIATDASIQGSLRLGRLSAISHELSFVSGIPIRMWGSVLRT